MEIRNFVIISHIDHGKSTLADRFLEITQTVPPSKMHSCYLDMMDLEQEKGVTIKMAPVRMLYKSNKTYVLNLIDTPGHADFSYEVSRSLKAVEGAVLLVDASKGVQAQTIFNLESAQKEGLKIIPVINKIDLPLADISGTEKQLIDLGFKKDEIIRVSAKTGENVKLLLDNIIHNIPPAPQEINKPLKALIFDSAYDQFKGVNIFVRVFEGKISRGEKIKFLASEIESEAIEVGYFKPHFLPSSNLLPGEIGYIKTGLKDPLMVKIGDTITTSNTDSIIKPIPGYQEPKPMVYAEIYPAEIGDFEKLKSALSKLRLNDASLLFSFQTSKAFGPGFRCGFLGLFHLEIVKERLQREYEVEVIVTKPQVDIKKIENHFYEPFMRLEIITPIEYLGPLMEVANIHRGEFKEIKYLEKRAILVFEIPFSEIITQFYDLVKNVSRGYASMFYQFLEYKKSDLVNIDILVGNEKIDALSCVVHSSKSQRVARDLVKKLKELIPPHLFEIKIQAVANNKIIASERIPPLRKDVTAPLYGGDVTRKRKLLEKQKEGKKRMKKFGKVTLPTDLFLKL